MLARGTMTVATRLDTDAAARATARLHDGLPPTIDAVAGGSSVRRAIGSAFSNQLPPGPWISNL